MFSSLDMEPHGQAPLFCFRRKVAGIPQQALGAATSDRLRDGAYRILLDGESHRKPRPMKRPTASAAVKMKAKRAKA